MGEKPTTVGHPTLITSVQRALLVIEMVADSPRPLAAKVVSRRSGLSLGTTYNLLRTLVHEGYLVADQDGYVLGDRFPGMTDTTDGVLIARGRASLNTLCRDLRAAAYLTVYHDGEIRLVDIVDSPDAPRVNLWVGIHDSAHATAFGKQILTELPEDDRRDYLRRHPPEELTPYTISDESDLLRTLSRPGRESIDRQEYSLGSRCIAVPLRTPAMIGSIAISLPAAHRATDAQLADAMHTEAAKLALRLGTARFGQFST